MALQRKDIITSAIGIIVLTLLCGILYPLVITGVSQVAFPGNANGQQVFVNGKLVGSKIIGQNFADPEVKNGKTVLDKNGNPVTNPDPRYFQTRPSGTTPADNAAATAFCQLRPEQHRSPSRRSPPTSRPTSSSTARYYPGGLTAAKVPVDAADTLGFWDRPRDLGPQRRHPGLPDRDRAPPVAVDGPPPDLQLHARARTRLLR